MRHSRSNSPLLQDTYGGDGSNYTKSRILVESPNILVYRACARNAERNFHLSGLTSAHGKPNLTQTFEALGRYMQDHKPNEHRAGRTSHYTVQDMIAKGIGILFSVGTEADIDADDPNDESIAGNTRPDSGDVGVDDNL